MLLIIHNIVLSLALNVIIYNIIQDLIPNTNGLVKIVWWNIYSNNNWINKCVIIIKLISVSNLKIKEGKYVRIRTYPVGEITICINSNMWSMSLTEEEKQIIALERVRKWLDIPFRVALEFEISCQQK